MKLKQKIFLSLAAMLIITIASTIIIILIKLSDDIEQEKVELYTSLSKQTLFSFDLLSDDIEYYVFNNMYNEKIPQIIYSNENIGLKRMKINHSLNIMSKNTSYIDDLFVFDLEQNFFQGSQDTASDDYRYYSSYLSSLEIDHTKDIAWFQDDRNNIYLKRSLYNLFPYEYVGYIIAIINPEHLMTAIGTGQLSGEYIYILSDNNNIFLSLVSEKTSEDYERDLLNLKKPYTESIVINKEDYRLIYETNNKEDLSIINLILRRELISSINSIRVFCVCIGILLIIISIFISNFVSKSLTLGIKELVKAMNITGHDNYKTTLPVNRNDEIGLLSRNLSEMLSRLDDLNKRRLENEATRQKEKYEFLELKYRSLQAQISPHFICNILSSINSSSLSGDIQKVETLSVLSSQYLRQNLSNVDKKFTSIRKELQTVKEYIKLYRSIYSLQFTFKVQADKETMQDKVPYLILQPLVENSLKYGQYLTGNRKLKINIIIYHENNRLAINITDNGPGFDQEKIEDIYSIISEKFIDKADHGFGLLCILQRLKLLYGEDYSFSIKSEQEKSSVISLLLPQEIYQK